MVNLFRQGTVSEAFSSGDLWDEITFLIPPGETGHIEARRVGSGAPWGAITPEMDYFPSGAFPLQNRSEYRAVVTGGAAYLRLRKLPQSVQDELGDAP